MTFPPDGPTTITRTAPSYLYQQYTDDDDVAAFVDAYNQMTQAYVTWFATVSLPVYSGLSGALLDWVAQGLYGISRPSLPSGTSQNLGALNTIPLNTLPLNVEDIVGPSDYYLTDDDVYKRIMTWALMKGDGKVFDIRWLKRRVMQFLLGTDGIPIDPGETYEVSVTFGVGNEVNINLQSVRRFATGGAMLNVGALNTFTLDEFETDSVSIPVSPLVPIFKAAVEAGVLELPFQYDFIVNT